MNTKLINKNIVIAVLIILNLILIYKLYDNNGKRNTYANFDATSGELNFASFLDDDIVPLIEQKWINKRINVLVFISGRGCSFCSDKVIAHSKHLIEKYPSFIKIVTTKKDQKLLKQHKNISNYFYFTDKENASLFINPVIVLMDPESKILLKYRITPEKQNDVGRLYILIEGVIRLTTYGS